MSKGYFTIAQGQTYQRLAYALALSLKISQPSGYNLLSIGVTPKELPFINPKYLEVFDAAVPIPWKDNAINSSWKLENEWKAIHMTPYDETIKLDADMLFPADVSHWWKYLELSDGVFATQAHTYRGHIVESDYYRKTFTENNLPNVYSAMFYFKKNDVNFEFFEIAEHIFNNWERYFYDFLATENRPKVVSTDVVFAIAAKIMDYQQYNKTPQIQCPAFVHMKTRLQDWPDDQFMSEDWTKMIPHYFDKRSNLKVGNYTQVLPFHYHVKDFITDKIIENMEKRLGI
jgi:hypothetical protein